MKPEQIKELPVRKRGEDGRRLTEKQKVILLYMSESLQEYDRMPSVREICANMGFASTNAAIGHLRALQRKGFLETVDKMGRNSSYRFKRETKETNE
jgi:SOS-response transcriptional repressor LexA